MILFEDADGLCCRPAELIASIVAAYPGRLRIVASDATVGYCYQAKDCTQPGLCQLSNQDWLDPNQLRRVQAVDGALLLTLESNEKRRVTAKWAPSVRTFLGLDQYTPQAECLTRHFLREYPFEIAWAKAEILTAHFSTPRRLIANLIWQALEFHRQGLNKGYGNSHHGFFYKPLRATLERAGFLNETFTKEAAERLFQVMLARMVLDDRLFNFAELGFCDLHAHQRELGSRHPHIILVIEKECLSDAGIAAARSLGISWIITGGVSHIIGVEFFCAALSQIYTGPVVAVIYGDFDPGGWLNGRTFVKHLMRYDTPCPDGPHYLIRPELFTQDELELFSRPLSSKDGRVEDWLAESGGIHGQARGIHADWLFPPERVQQALQALLGLR